MGTGYKQFDDELQGMTAHQLHEVCRMLMRDLPDEQLVRLTQALRKYKGRPIPARG